MGSLSQFWDDTVSQMNENERMNNEKIKQCLSANHLNAETIYNQDVPVRGIDICSNYSITTQGVNNIDLRMKNYIQAKAQSIYEKYGMKLLYFDQMELYANNCQYSYDGRHYIDLLPLESVVVLNIIDK